MSCMIVSYGEDNGESSINLLFGKMILQLLEIEELSEQELFQWCLATGIHLLDGFWKMEIDSMDLALAKFLICLKLSNEQLEHCAEVINSESNLLVAEVNYEWLNFNDIYDLHDVHPLKSAIIDLFMTNLFLKCRIVCTIKESLENLGLRKNKGQDLHFKKNNSAKYVGENENLIVNLPWKFPDIFERKVTYKHTLNSRLHISFLKWILKDSTMFYKDVDSPRVVSVKVKVDLKWQEKKYKYPIWTCENEQSQTSIALKKIKQRQLERQKIFQHGNLSFGSGIDALKLFEKDENMERETNQKWRKASAMRKFEVPQVREHSIHKENVENSEIGTNNSLGLLSQLRHDIGADLNREILTPVVKFSERNPLESDILPSWSRIMFVPRLGDPTEADCILKIEAGSPKDNRDKDIGYSTFLRPEFNGQLESDFSGKNLSSPPIDTKITFKKFMKTKFQEVKSEIKYYRQVAKYCIEDFKKASADSVSF